MSKYSKVPKGWYSNACYWYFPGKKKPIAYSTVAANNLIVAMAEFGDTIQEIHDKILFDEEAKKVLNEYIKRGWGDKMGKDVFRMEIL